jgi:hypothetical protein
VLGEEACKIWATLELVFCNCTCLHVAFLSMDAFLRLKELQLRSSSLPQSQQFQARGSPCSLLLWLGAPWAISCVQGVAQFMLSQAEHGVVIVVIEERRSQCLVQDKNFLLLGALFAFVIPGAVSCAFCALCVREVRAIRRGKFIDDDSARVEDGETTSCSEEDDAEEEVVLEEEAPQQQQEEHEEVCTTSFGGGGHANFAFNSSCILLLSSDGVVPSATTAAASLTTERDAAEGPDDWLRRETAVSRLALCLLLGCVAPWLPYSLANSLRACSLSSFSSSAWLQSGAGVLRWLAYCSAAAAPVAQLRFSPPVRRTVRRCLTCKRS